MIADQPPLPVDQAVIAYYEQAQAPRSTTVTFSDGSTYTMKLVPNKFEKSRRVCVIMSGKKLNSIVWATNGDDHFVMTPAPQSDGMKTGEQGDFMFDACASTIVNDLQRRNFGK